MFRQLPYQGLKLPPTPVLTIQALFGVVDFAYIRVRSEPPPAHRW